MASPLIEKAMEKKSSDGKGGGGATVAEMKGITNGENEKAEANPWQVKPLMFTGVLSLALAAGLGGFYFWAQQLAVEAVGLTTGVSEEQLKLVGYLFLAQGIIVLSTGLMALLTPIWEQRLLGIVTATGIAVTVVPNWQLPIYWVGIIPLALMAFGWQIQRALRLFKKFSLHRIVFYHVSTVYLAMSIFIAAGVFAFLGNNPVLIEKSINQYIVQMTKTVVSSQITPRLKEMEESGKQGQAEMEKDISEQSAGILDQLPIPRDLIPEDWLSNWVESYQLMPENMTESLVADLESELISQVQGWVGPYMKYLPYVITIVTFLSFYEVSVLVNLLYIIVGWVVLKLLILAGVAELVEEKQPVEVLRLR
jgi:hypothetical protein